MTIADDCKKLGDYDPIQRNCRVLAISTIDLKNAARIWNFSDGSALKQTWDDFEIIEAVYDEAIEHNPGGLTYLEALERAKALGFNKLLDPETGDYSISQAIRYEQENQLKELGDIREIYHINHAGWLLKDGSADLEFVYDPLLAVEEAGIDLKAVESALQARRAAKTSEKRAQASKNNGKKGGRPAEPAKEYMICYFTNTTSHPVEKITCTKRAAILHAKKVIKHNYEPDCQYMLKEYSEDSWTEIERGSL